MLRRFASDCSCLFTASQIGPENSLNVAIPTSAISLSDIAIYAYVRLDGLSFGSCTQRSLGELDLGRVQLKMLVSSFGRRGHRITPFCRKYITYVHTSECDVHYVGTLVRARPVPNDAVSVTFCRGCAGSWNANDNLEFERRIGYRI